MRDIKFLVLALVSLVCSCKSKPETKEENWEKVAQETVTYWQGRKMTLPADLPIFSNDSLVHGYDKICHNPLRMVTYVDGTCGVCIGNLTHWKKFMDYIDKHNGKCDFIFFNSAAACLITTANCFAFVVVTFVAVFIKTPRID